MSVMGGDVRGGDIGDGDPTGDGSRGRMGDGGRPGDDVRGAGTSGTGVEEPSGGLGPVDLARATDPALVGRKAHGLARAAAAGFRVPDAVVLPTSLTRRLQAGEAVDLAPVLEGLVDRLGGVVAVRSSGIDEDTDTASYAGQYDTVLDVTSTADLVAAVHDCVRSASTSAAAGYRAHAGGDSTDMAVLVQRMLAPEVAGVAFGLDPVTGRDHVVVEATAGVGEGVLAGTVTPEHWTVADAPVLASAPGEPALTTGQAGEVAALCRAVGAREGRPADIEWAFEHGQLFLLQVRPITAVPLEPTERPPSGETWIREPRFDRPIDPLTFSTWLPRHGRAMEVVFARFGLPMRGISNRRYLGRVYYRTVPLLHGNDRTAPPAPVLKLLLRVVPPLRRRLRTAAAAAETSLVEQVVADWEDHDRDRVRLTTRRLRQVDLAGLDDGSLATHLDAVLDHVLDAAIVHFEVAFAAVYIATGRLGLFLEDRLGWSPAEVIGLVSGYGDGSVAHGRVLAELAEELGPDGIARGIADPSSLLGHPAVATYLDRFGHRADVGLALPTEAESPAILAHHLRRFADGVPERGDPTIHAHELEQRARTLLADPADLARFDDALALARRGRPYGDESEGDILEALALVRHVALEAAGRLVDAGRLGRVDDVWFLQVEELAAMLASSRVATPDIDRRRREHRWAETNPAPDHMGPAPLPPPAPRLFPRRARPVVGALMWSILAAGMDPVREDGTAGGTGDAAGLVGMPGSPGQATGTVRVVRDPADFPRIRPGDILVCPITMASWSPVFAVIGGLVTERGGPLSHPATLAREYGIPAVLALPSATSLLADGATVTVDGGAGSVEIL